jgi:hypothetical protein
MVKRSPSPRPSPPGEGESLAVFGRDGRLGFAGGYWSKGRKGGECNEAFGIGRARQNALPLLGGEGRGEGERDTNIIPLARP